MVPQRYRIRSSVSKATRAPSPQTVPESSRERLARSSSALGRVSASTKIRDRPRDAAAPALRARAIRRSGSRTTCAPCLRAISAVPSVEALSTTTISAARPSSPSARCSTGRVFGNSSASFQAGTMTDTSGSAGAARHGWSFSLVWLVGWFTVPVGHRRQGQCSRKQMVKCRPAREEGQPTLPHHSGPTNWTCPLRRPTIGISTRP